MDKVAITVAPLAQSYYDDVSSFPTPERLAQEIYECYQAGASVVHLHVIDGQGRATVDTTNFRQTVRRLRDRCDIIVQGSTGGVSDLTRDERSVSVEVPEVEMGSLNMGSCNVGEQAYINTPGDVEYWAAKMRQHRVLPEMTFFEPGMMTMMHRLLEKKLVARPLVVNLALGFPGTLPAAPDNILFMARQLPTGTVWMLTPHHARDFSLHALSVALGGNVRVGFEDSMYLAPDKKAANNVELVAKARALIESLGRQVMTPAETRALYGLAGK
ncbi:MAG: 3-keto-5-aminohexanoate cleavage protein [Planctomycetes bacterium]|jgi:3-keto-5-aminohexanoate cleavage enzyme|nr:3-keto-5-aminohexanoate cleavage protein [Planctomycetota bacterium]